MAIENIVTTTPGCSPPTSITYGKGWKCYLLDTTAPLTYPTTLSICVIFHGPTKAICDAVVPRDVYVENVVQVAEVCRKLASYCSQAKAVDCISFIVSPVKGAA